jgi:WD40 repeat protein
VADVFVSYSRTDREFVRRLVDALTRNGKDVWIDWEDIPAASEWRSEIAAGIDGADAFVYVISPDAVTSPECAKELDHAIAQGKRIVPLLYREPPRNELRPEIRDRQWIRFDDGEFGAAFETLLRALDTDLGWVKAHTDLLRRAEQWERRRDPSRLLRGAALRDAEAQLAGRAAGSEPGVTPLQTRFVHASRTRATRQQRITLGIVLFALAVTSALAIVAWILRGTAIDRERTARSRELAALADAQLRIDPELSLILARSADESRETVESTAVLRAALAASRVRARLDVGPSDFENPILDARLSADGEHIRVFRRTTSTTWSLARRTRIGTDRNGLPEPDLPAAVAAVAVGDDGVARMTIDADGLLRFRAGRGAPWRVLDRLELTVPARGLAADVTLDGRLVAAAVDNEATESGGGPTEIGDKVARVWDLATPRLVTLSGHSSFVNDVRFSADGRRVVTASDDGTARVWDVRRGRTRVILRGHTAPVVSARFDSDGDRVVTASEDGTVRVWDVRLAVGIRVLDGEAAAVAHDGTCAVAARRGATIRVWPPAARREAAAGAPVRHDVSEAAAGRRCASVAASDGAVETTIVRSGKSRALRGRLVTFSRDGRLALVDRVGSGSVLDLDAGTAQPVTWGVETVTAATFDEDGSRFVAVKGDPRTTAGYTPPRLWSVTGAPLRTLGGERPVYAADIRGEVVATAGEDAVVELWLPDRKSALELRGHGDRILDIEFSRAGRSIVSASRDGTARVWPADGRGSAVILGPHGDAVQAATFSPAGDLVATISADGTVRVWDAATGDPVLAAPAQSVTDVRFAAGGRRLVAAARGVLVVDCEVCADVEALRDLAARRITRSPTAAERARYGL